MCVALVYYNVIYNYYNKGGNLGMPRYKKGQKHIETDFHIKAFETYYHMRERSLAKLSDVISVPLPTVQYWSRAFKWQERVQKRDAQLKKYVEKKALIGLSKTVDMADQLIEDAIDAVGKGKIFISNVNDIRKVIDIYTIAINATKDTKNAIVGVDMSAEASNTITQLFQELAGSNIENEGKFTDASDLELRSDDNAQ